MRRVRSAIVSCLFLLAAGCASSGESTRVREFVGEQPAAVFASADRVEVFRIGSSRDQPDAPRQIVGYPLLATGKEQGNDFAKRLGKVLLNDGTYEWDLAKGCKFDPGVAFRIWTGNHSALALICFHCDQIGIIADESSPRSLRVHDADPGRAALLKLARESFPDDRDLQKLTTD